MQVTFNKTILCNCVLSHLLSIHLCQADTIAFIHLDTLYAQAKRE